MLSFSYIFQRELVIKCIISSLYRYVKFRAKISTHCLNIKISKVTRRVIFLDVDVILLSLEK